MGEQIRADSKEFVVVPLTKVPVGIDLSSDTFEMAFVTKRTSPATWHAAIYDATDNTVAILVGPGALVLAPGFWVVLLRVTDSPEIPVIVCPGGIRVLAVA